VSVVTFTHGKTGNVASVLGAGASLLRKYLHSPLSSQFRGTFTCTVSEARYFNSLGQYTHGCF